MSDGTTRRTYVGDNIDDANLSLRSFIERRDHFGHDFVDTDDATCVNRAAIVEVSIETER